MKKLPIGIQNFNKLIENNYLYVDKTPIIYDLMTSGGGYYFLSRPRRFGKSLLISTLKEIFLGNQELFQGLGIYEKITWEKHPVVHIDFSSITHSKGGEDFENNLGYFLERRAQEYEIKLEAKANKEKLNELVQKLYQKLGNKVVLLIDEYDKPIIDHISNKEKAEANKEILANFYETIKSLDGYLKFVFITGVSKFSKVSIFSKLNNLKDITRRKEYHSICGYTQAEVEEYFAAHINYLCQETNVEKSKLLTKIQYWYNGYKWSGEETIYNPFAVLYLFDSKEFQNYWFQTATPTFLIKLIKEQQVAIEDFEGYQAGEEIFDFFELENLDPAALLFQTGYLTIKRISNRIVTFGYPNFEVKESFLVHLLAAYTNMFTSRIKPVYLGMLEYLEKENLINFKKALTALLAGIPTQLHLDYESYYHSLSYLILALLGAEITDKGRIDAVLELERIVYIIEFKMDQAEAALTQIKKRRYYEKYLEKQKKIILLGVGGFRQKEIEVLSEALLVN